MESLISDPGSVGPTFYLEKNVTVFSLEEKSWPQSLPHPGLHISHLGNLEASLSLGREPRHQRFKMPPR